MGSGGAVLFGQRNTIRCGVVATVWPLCTPRVRSPYRPLYPSLFRLFPARM